MNPGTILHIDMNAFFASVEQRADPTLREKPIAVAGSKTRGVVLSPSYEARAYGVKTGMTYGEAKKACPHIIMVAADSAKYSAACEQLLGIWQEFTPLVELFSIDEAFLDVTGCEALFGDPVRMALLIKERIWEAMKLTCSIGIGPNKLLAKLGSDMQKPDGLVLISSADVAGVLEDLPVQQLCGIGPSLTKSLAAMGIGTCGELARAPLRQLTSRFGILGERLRDMGRGIDDGVVTTQQEQADEMSRSMGHSMTLDEDCANVEEIERHILQLAEKVARRLRRGLYSGRTVTLTLRYADFHTFSRQRRLQRAVNHGLDIHAAAVGILHEIPLAQAVRLVGVSVSSLERNVAQMPLFPHERRKAFVADAMDEINDRYGSFTVTWGTLAERHRHGRVISPAWRPVGDRQY
ncbi:MAG: DNA polymerase IV [Nitrospirae bacterium GWC2_57_9]|nr:MAG: DNA polymerase IV [Nitrospirae bacterium GWC2_57_9]